MCVFPMGHAFGTKKENSAGHNCGLNYISCGYVMRTANSHCIDPH